MLDENGDPVPGVSTSVTFAATAVDPAPPEPVIHLGAGQRVNSYWINTNNGTLCRLVGSSVENIATGGKMLTPPRFSWGSMSNCSAKTIDT